MVPEEYTTHRGIDVLLPFCGAGRPGQLAGTGRLAAGRRPLPSAAPPEANRLGNHGAYGQEPLLSVSERIRQAALRNARYSGRDLRRKRDVDHDRMISLMCRPTIVVPASVTTGCMPLRDRDLPCPLAGRA